MNKSSLLEESKLPSYKIILLGRSGSGKTSLLARYHNKIFKQSTAMTLGVEYMLLKREKAHYAYYDTAGQERYSSIVKGYYHGADAVLFIYDLHDPASFTALDLYHQQVSELLPNSLLYLAGTKSDLTNNLPPNTAISTYAHCTHFSVSAKTGHNVSTLFQSLEQHLLDQIPKKSSCELGFRANSTISRKEKKCCD